MGIVSGLVLFIVVWFLSLFVMIPITVETQEEAGENVEGTHKGAPSSRFSMRRTLGFTTIVAVAIWLVLAWVILFSGLTVEDIDFMGISRRGQG